MQKEWVIKLPHPRNQILLADALNVHPIIAQLLVNRSIQEVGTARDFLAPSLTLLHDPMRFKDMAKAVDRIRQAASEKQKVLIFGDYDVDGVTSSVILNKVLKSMGIDVVHHIPHRMTDGYGLNHDIADVAREQGVALIITIDCGVTAFDEVETIRSQGIDVIVIDHHEPSEGRLPDATAIIDPKQADCDYPFNELASVGLAYKLAQVLAPEICDEVLDFVALGTVADVAPLVDENRILVKAGLKQILKTRNKGLRALLQATKMKRKPITPFHIGFVLGPRINAAGRMDSALTALNLFLSDDEREAYSLAMELESYNYDRQKMQNNTISEAMEIVEAQIQQTDSKIIVLNKEGWHKGVLGIVASRLTDKYYRPSVVISTENGVGTASCRSIDGFHIQQALEQCQEVLENFGGHEGAAGLTIQENQIDPFRKMINDIAQSTLEIRKLTPKIYIDCEIPVNQVDLSLANTVEQLQPFGEGNAVPVFCSRRLVVKSYPQILGKGTLKFWVERDDQPISAIGFGMERFADMISPGRQIDMAYEISIDDWNKAPEAQLRIKDIKSST